MAARTLIDEKWLIFRNFHMLKKICSRSPIDTPLGQIVVLLFCLNCESLKKFGPVVSEIWAVEYCCEGYRLLQIDRHIGRQVGRQRYNHLLDQFCNFQISASKNSTDLNLGSLERTYSKLCYRLKTTFDLQGHQRSREVTQSLF